MTSARSRIWRWASLVVGVVLISYTAFRHFAWYDLRVQKASLQREADRLRVVEAEIKSLREKVASEANIAALGQEEVAVDQARRDIENIERALSAGTTGRAAPIQPASPPPTPRVWKNAGQMSPHEAIETLVWASSSGRVENLKDTVLLSPADEARVASLYAGLPEATRLGYGSPANLFATLLAAKMPTDLSDYEIQGQREQNGVFEVDLALVTGSRAKTGKRAITLVLQRQGSVWKVQVPPSQVTAVLAMVKGAERKVQ